MLSLISSEDESVNILIQAIQINPNDAVAHFRIGLALSKDVEEYSKSNNDIDATYTADIAIDYYTQAIEIDPNYSDSYYYRGLLREYLARYYYTGEVEDYLAGCCEISTYLEDFQLAIDDYAQCIKVDPNYADAYTSMGKVLNAVKNFKDLTEKINL